MAIVMVPPTKVAVGFNEIMKVKCLEGAPALDLLGSDYPPLLLLLLLWRL